MSVALSPRSFIAGGVVRGILLFFALVLIQSSTGCAAIFMGGGSHEYITIQSNAPRTQIFVDGIERGYAPMGVGVKRGDDHVIVALTEAGRREAYVNSSVGTGGFLLIFLDVILFGLVGLLVDVFTDSGRSLSPETVNFSFSQSEFKRPSMPPGLTIVGSSETTAIFMDSGRIAIKDQFEVNGTEDSVFVIPQNALSYVEYEEAAVSGAPWRRSDYLSTSVVKNGSGSLDDLPAGKYYIRRNIVIASRGSNHQAMKVAKITVPGPLPPK